MKLIATPIQVYANRIAEIDETLNRRRAIPRFWTEVEIRKLMKLYNQGISIPQIATELPGRTESAIRGKLHIIFNSQALVKYASDRAIKPKK